MTSSLNKPTGSGRKPLRGGLVKMELLVPEEVRDGINQRAADCGSTRQDFLAPVLGAVSRGEVRTVVEHCPPAGNPRRF